jgi:methyl-accepting chemotaxis protein
MNSKTRRVFAIILFATAILGWIISLSGVVAVWYVRPRLTRAVVSQVEVLQLTLEVTNKGLQVSQDSLQAIIVSLDTLQKTVQATANTVNGTSPFLDSLIKITDQSLPQAVEGLKSSLETAQQGAQVVDEALRRVTNIPLLGQWLSDRGYDPTTPLDQGLSKVADGVTKLDDTFQGMTESLTNTRDTIQSVQSGIGDMADNIGEITTNLEETKQVLSEYQTTIQSVLDFLDRWGERFPQLIIFVAVLFTVLFIWIAATQVGLFLQAMQYYRDE